MSKLRPSTCVCARSIDFVTHAVLDRDALLHAEALHEPRQAVGSEDAHEVVLEREVEARGARVALAAGAAAELVVDAPRLVPLGADDVEAAELDDLLVRLGRAPSGARRAIFSRSPRESRPSPSGVARYSGLPPRRMSVPRPAMFVAIVTAGSWPACATIVGLPLVVLRVQDVVRHRRLLEHASRDARTSRSRSCRRGRAGPSRCISVISSTTASNFSRSVR